MFHGNRVPRLVDGRCGIRGIGPPVEPVSFAHGRGRGHGEDVRLRGRAREGIIRGCARTAVRVVSQDGCVRGLRDRVPSRVERGVLGYFGCPVERLGAFGVGVPSRELETRFHGIGGLVGDVMGLGALDRRNGRTALAVEGDDRISVDVVEVRELGLPIDQLAFGVRVLVAHGRRYNIIALLGVRVLDGTDRVLGCDLDGHRLGTVAEIPFDR